LAKFSKEFDICLGDFNEKGVVAKEFASVNMDFTYFMSAEDLKKFPKDKLPEPITFPKYFDLSKAERVYITQEEVLRRVEEEQEKLRNL